MRAVICLHGGNRYALPLSAVRRVTDAHALASVESFAEVAMNRCCGAPATSAKLRSVTV